MANTIRVIRDVPTDRKEQLEGQYRAVGATVVWTKQSDGNWTLTANVPEAASAAALAGGASGGPGGETSASASGGAGTKKPGGTG